MTSHKVEVPATTGMLVSPQLPTEPRCPKCGGEMDVLRATLTSKVAGKWKCTTRNTHTVQLSRIFGSWPITQFKGLDEQAKLDCMKKVGDAGTADNIKAVRINQMVKLRVESWRAKREGTYLPLSVYKKMGWDTVAIQRTCHMELHEQLGCPRTRSRRPRRARRRSSRTSGRKSSS